MENPKKKYVRRLLSTLQTTANKILFDFLNNRQYNYNKRVASKHKSSLPAARFYFEKNNSKRYIFIMQVYDTIGYNYEELRKIIYAK